METNANTITELKNKFKNKRCFLIGNGPTLRFHDLKKLKNEYVFVASWFAFHKEYKNLKNIFYCFAAPQIWGTGRLGSILHNSLIKNNHIKYFIEDSFFALNRKYKYFSEDDVYYIGMQDGLRDGSIIETDLTKPISIAASIMQDLMLPAAYYLGFNEMYLIGCDSDLQLDEYPDWSHSHFYSTDLMPPEIRYHTTQESEGIKAEVLNKLYLKFKEHFEKNNRYIFNATEGGKLTAFKRINFDSLF